MSNFPRISALVALLAGVAACAPTPSPDLATGAAAYDMMPPVNSAAVPEDYVISPDDVLSVQVFQEPELSNDKLKVDQAGKIQMQLLGTVDAQGRTSGQLSREIAGKLGQRYLVNPAVVVNVVETAPRFFTVEGQIKSPGVYQIGPDFTLLSAIARAQSTTNIARLDEVIIFRNVEGQRMGAIFDLKAIRKGRAADPQVLPGDKIVVGFSQVKGAYRDFLQTVPLLNLFTQF